MLRRWLRRGRVRFIFAEPGVNPMDVPALYRSVQKRRGGALKWFLFCGMLAALGGLLWLAYIRM